MKFTLPLSGLLACAMTLFTAISHADEKTEEAVTVARQWLALVDAKEYKKSWEEAAPYFQEHVALPLWEQQIAAVRKPLGKVTSRELMRAQYATALPGAPEGEYVVIQFKTNFADKPDSIETVTPMMADGSWRVSGYYIK